MMLCLYLQIGYSSAPGEGAIYGLEDYERVFSPHIVRLLPLCSTLGVLYYNVTFSKFSHK